MVVGVVGSGAMGSGIAQVAAMAGHEVRMYDSNTQALDKAMSNITQSINKLLSKEAVSAEVAKAVMGRIYITSALESFKDCGIVIEAIIESKESKKEVFNALEAIVSTKCIMATNTSSLSVTLLASGLRVTNRFIGIHFFNPPFMMKLVEIIPALQTDQKTITTCQKLIESWGKIVVLAKDTPGFIVNKVARPYYSEAIRIVEEGMATIEEVDSIMVANGFRMGPFELMDFIGHDVNYKVTETVWQSFYYDTRYTPSFLQSKLVEAGYLGRKTGRGFYNYEEVKSNEVINVDQEKSKRIFDRILSLMINEAADTVFKGMCSLEDVDKAMKYGVNYPKGLMQWGKDLGYENVIETLQNLYAYYQEERYRICPLLRNLVKN